ncbi:two-component regulator propeller domain-containing protein [Capnocytophaga sp. ARDL2]|uniref:two-component regulator propeller domain-containing protein n=1 Tax=Capnocytophaga sp. ARDL2 TaxID=3238809 RepID=UPI003556FA6D
MFNDFNSDTIFCIGQTDDGKVWVGSYNGYLSIIDGEKITQSKANDIRFLLGCRNYGNQLIVNNENGLCISLFNSDFKQKTLATDVAGFYNFISSDNILYVGTNTYKRLMYKAVKDLENSAVE